MPVFFFVTFKTRNSDSNLFSFLKTIIFICLTLPCEHNILTFASVSRLYKRFYRNSLYYHVLYYRSTIIVRTPSLRWRLSPTCNINYHGSNYQRANPVFILKSFTCLNISILYPRESFIWPFYNVRISCKTSVITHIVSNYLLRTIITYKYYNIYGNHISILLLLCAIFTSTRSWIICDICRKTIYMSLCLSELSISSTRCV